MSVAFDYLARGGRRSWLFLSLINSRGVVVVVADGSEEQHRLPRLCKIGTEIKVKNEREWKRETCRRTQWKRREQLIISRERRDFVSSPLRSLSRSARGHDDVRQEWQLTREVSCTSLSFYTQGARLLFGHNLETSRSLSYHSFEGNDSEGLYRKVYSAACARSHFFFISARAFLSTLSTPHPRELLIGLSLIFPSGKGRADRTGALARRISGNISNFR